MELGRKSSPSPCGRGFGGGGFGSWRGSLPLPLPQGEGEAVSDSHVALMNFLGFLITQCLNALSQAALLFFLGVGLTLIFGIMRIVNFAHGAFFMLGAYVGYSAVAITGSFWAALIAAPLLVGAFGAAFETGHSPYAYTNVTTVRS